MSPETDASLSASQLTVLDVAQGLLERGDWTVPSWRVEKWLAERCNKALGLTLAPISELGGSLGFSVVDGPRGTKQFQNALVTARWQCEATDSDPMEIWDGVPTNFTGSEAEKAFFAEVIVPSLGFPLLDYLRLQPTLSELGLDPKRFFGQRVDFAIDTGRGIRLVIEVDGPQHNDLAEATNDEDRDEALRQCGWMVWRVPTSRLEHPDHLREEFLRVIRHEPEWGFTQALDQPRDKEVLSCVWGATAVSRIQFLILESLRSGALPWTDRCNIRLIEHDTDVGELAIEDLNDWFGRLLRFYECDEVPEIVIDERVPSLIIDVSVIRPHKKPAIYSGLPLAHSRPAQCDGGVYSRRYGRRHTFAREPGSDLIESFLADIFRKRSLRDGQLDIIRRIVCGKDVIGLLPTGGGKSLTYQMCGLLLGGMTIYVSPLRSLIQDQHEHLSEMGITAASMLMSGLDHLEEPSGVQAAGIRFLMLTPERFLIDSFREDLKQYRAIRGEVAQIVIDECHCVSEWGHEFRPAYLSLSRIARERTRRLDISAPLVALTGTASSVVLSDVMRELGINSSEAIVRARRLDRPEIEMICIETPQAAKPKRVRELVADFYLSNTRALDGLLIFCPFVNGGDGVMGAVAAVSEALPDHAYRIYTGASPEWAKFAAVKLKKKAVIIPAAIVEQHKPTWASGNDSWESLKEKWQRQFISGTKHSFRVMIATKAFGMGIDKPSIRRIVHWMSAASPEAYYQEIGRACRDGRRGDAFLVFSDENPKVTDTMLDPGSSLDEARQTYKEFQAKSKFSGGDFIRTFFFHDKTFAGEREDVIALRGTLSQVRDSVDQENRIVVKNPESQDGRIEYAVLRLILLGIIEDYTKDYRLKTLVLRPTDAWLKVRDDAKGLAFYYAQHFRSYALRYQVSPNVEGIDLIQSASNISDADGAAASAVVKYVYSQIERKRRQASRKMLELARTGINDPAAFRRDLLLYLQVSERFTATIEQLAAKPKVDGWASVVEEVEHVDEMRELHGACQRVLESYPNHPSLLFLSAITRVDPSSEGVLRSAEEFDAALRYGESLAPVGEILRAGEDVLKSSQRMGGRLGPKLQERYGVWLVDQGYGSDAMRRFSNHRAVRQRWLARSSSNLTTAFQLLRGGF